MAVEIPVVIDIDKAFEDAASRVGTAMKSLQREVDANTLKLDIIVGEDEEGNSISMKFKQIKDGAVKDMATLRAAINSVNQELIETAQSGDKVKFSALLEAKHYMEDMVRAAQVSKSQIDGLAYTMQGLSSRIQAARQTLETSRIGSPEWEKAAEEMRKVSIEAENVQGKLAEMGTRTGSLDALNLKLQELERRWNAMGSGAMFTASGGLTSAAQHIQDEYTKIVNKIEQQNKLLTAQIDKQREAEQAAKKKAAEEEKAINAYIAAEERREAAEKKHREELEMSARSLNDLNTKLRAWQAELNSADIGSSKWKVAAGEVAELSAKIKEITTALQQVGVHARSIDGLNAKIQSLNAQWNKMGVAAKYLDIDFKELTPEAQKLYQEYKAHVSALKQHGQTLDQILQKEQQRSQLTQRNAQKRKYENAILNASVKSIRVLQEQERILSDRLNRSVIGSSKYEQLKKQLEAVRAELNKINGKSIKDIGDEAGRAESKLASLVKNSLRLVALHTGTRFIKNVREVTAEFELQKVALGSIIQDTSRAESLFREIKAAAIESPFEIKDLVSYTKQLSAYQIETDKLFSTTMRLADISAGLGVDMGRLILAFGQVRAASVLRGQELRQFTEAGIPLVDKLAEKFSELNHRTVTTAEVFDLISKRAVPFAMIEEIFREMTDAGGMFYKMQEKQAETLAGQWANLKDSISIMYDEIGRTEVVHGAMTTLIKDAKWLFQNWRSWANMIKVAGTALLSYVAISKSVAAWNAIVAKAEKMAAAAESVREKNIKGLITSIIGKTAAEKVSILSTKLYTAATNKASAANTALGKTFWNLVAAMATNPFGLLAIAIGGAVAGLINLKNKVYDVEKAISDADSSIGALRKNREETSKLIKSYTELSQKTSLSEKEQRKLKDTSRELAKTFPKATEAIDQNTGALVLNVQKLQEYSEASRKVIEEGMRGEIRENEKAIEKNEKKIERIQKLNQRGWGFGPGGFYYSINDKDAKRLSNTLIKLTDDTDLLRDKNEELKDALEGTFRTIDDAPTELPRFDGDGGGDRLSQLKQDIDDITNAYKKYIELLKYESAEAAKKDIGVLFPSLQGWEPSYDQMIAKMEQMLEQYSGDADASRIIEQALANVKFDKIKSDLNDSLKKLSEDIRQSETARNFFGDILGLTGDNALAATLTANIYGNVGKDFAGRIQEQLNEALKHIRTKSVGDELRKAVVEQDFKKIFEYLDQFPPEWQDKLKEMAAANQKYQAEEAINLFKALERAKSYSEQQVELAKQTAKRVADIRSLKVGGDVQEQLLKQNSRKQAEESAKIAYEAFKDTPMYIELFSDLDAASLRMLTNMRENLAKMKDNWKNLHPRELKELQSRLNELDEQIAQRNPFKALANSIKAYRDLQKQRSTVEVEEAAIAANQRLQSEEELLQVYGEEYVKVKALGKDHEAEAMVAKEKMEIQQQAVDAAKEEADAAQQTAYEYKNAKKHIQDAAEKMQEWAGYVTGSLEGIEQIVGTFASDDFADTFNIIAEGLGKTVTGAAQLGKGIAELSTGNPQGIVDTLQGLGDVVAGTFGTKNQLNIKKLNKKIDEQQDLLDGLTYSYDRLEKAMAKAFGSDYIYNYNEQLKNLRAQQAAYEEQLRLEQNKGKKKDKDKIKDYQDSIQEVEDQIIDMSGGLSEFFTGSDVKSAAEEFANSWIEAYKSFSSTTGAMQAKFQDMIGNMITQSLAGQMMQRLLQPIFDEIDRLSEDGELTAAEIGSISDMATAAIPQIDAAMTGLVNNLAGAGINLRQQAGQFTGISRDIAGASEESILGLAAAVNTANFYISHVPTISENVAAIREVLTGEAVPGRRNTAATRGDVEGPTYEDQMLAYAASIPLMRDDTATIRALLERVIKPVGTTATHYVSIR